MYATFTKKIVTNNSNHIYLSLVFNQKKLLRATKYDGFLNSKNLHKTERIHEFSEDGFRLIEPRRKKFGAREKNFRRRDKSFDSQEKKLNQEGTNSLKYVNQPRDTKRARDPLRVQCPQNLADST